MQCFLRKSHFVQRARARNRRGELKNSAESYLCALLKNGQIYGDYLIAWSNGRLVAYAYVARPDSLAKRHHSEWSESSLNTVIKVFGQSPECNVIDDNAPKRFRSWKRSTSLYLFTHAFDNVSPVCCGDTGFPIPLYLLPLDQRERESLHFWACAYRRHDNLWIDSAALEIPAYKQLADPTSKLSVTGRTLCAEVERSTGKRTFYFLQRYWGRNVGEDARPCPLCGGDWRTFAAAEPFHQFHFRCIPCRLVSHVADSYEDERHARIGDFKKLR